MNVGDGIVILSLEEEFYLVIRCLGWIGVGNENGYKEKEKDVKNKNFFFSGMVLSLWVNVGEYGCMGILLNIILICRRKYRLFMISIV